MNESELELARLELEQALDHLTEACRAFVNARGRFVQATLERGQAILRALRAGATWVQTREAMAEAGESGSESTLIRARRKALEQEARDEAAARRARDARTGA